MNTREYINKEIEEIDEMLSDLENYAHGEESEKITNCRSRISKIKEQIRLLEIK